MKKILIALGVVVAVVVAGIAYVYTNLDEIVRTAIEDSGSRVTKVDVTLGGVQLDLTNGQGSLENLVVGNPTGFNTDHAFSLGGVSVSVDPTTLNSDTITIKEVVVAAPNVIYELSGSNSNIRTIQDNVEAFTKTMSSGEEASSESSEGPKLVIENLYVRDGEVAVSADFLEGRKTGISLPTIHLTDIGKDSGGATPAEVAAKVISAVNKSVIGTISKIDLKGLAEGAGKVIEGAGGVVEGGADGVKGATEKAGDALKGILGD